MKNINIFKIPILGFFAKDRRFLLPFKWIVLMIFLYAIFLGFFINDTRYNFTKAVFWSLFWPFFVTLTLATFGRAFCAICPHGFVGQFITKFGLNKKFPKFMKNRIVGIFLLIVPFWCVYYMYPHLYKSPLNTSILFLVMSIVAVLFFYMYEKMSYCKYICPVGTMMRIFSKISFTWLGTDKSSCKSCKEFSCAKACKYSLKPFGFDVKNSMDDCTLCMDCANACKSVEFRLVKPSSSLFSKFKPLKAEIWALLFITATISITMNFHHALSRVVTSEPYLWIKMGNFLQKSTQISGLDFVGLSALFLALTCTISLALLGNFIASKALHVDFEKTFYSLSYAYVPIFIIGGLSHSLSFFFLRYYSNIINGFNSAFYLGFEPVKPLVTAHGGWLSIFSILGYIASIWAFIILYKRLKLFGGSKVSKTIAFFASSLLIVFFLGLNIYKAYAFSHYKTNSHHKTMTIHKKG